MEDRNSMKFVQANYSHPLRVAEVGVYQGGECQTVIGA